MLGIFEGLEEYNNSGALIGLDAIDDTELLGALKRMNPIKRQRTINKLSNTGTPSRGSRAEMEKFFGELPAHIKEGLGNGTLRLCDSLIYSIKPVNSKTIKMFEPQDDRMIGLRNISNAKLQKNQVLLVSGLVLLAGTSADATTDNVMATDYKSVESFPAIINGEIDLKANKKIIIPETGNYVFKTSNMHFVPMGYYKLANPRLIEDDVPIELTISLGSTTGIAANTYLYAALHGTGTTA